MSNLFNMYHDAPQVDISGTLAQLRRGEKDRTDANWKGSKDLLRGVASDTIRKDYKDGISWDNGVKSADDSFKKQYDRMMSVDPQAAAQLREDYQAERTRRLNAEVAGAYKSKSEGVSGEIQALEQEIQDLEAEIQADEKAAQAQANSAQEAGKMEGYTPTSPDADVIEVASRNDLKKATPDLYAQQGRAEEQIQGYAPAATGLRSFYGAYPEPVVYPLAPDRVPSATALDPAPEETPGPWAKGPGMPKKPSLQNLYGAR